MDNQSQENNRELQSQSTTEISKKRHIIVTICLWLMVIGNTYLALLYFVAMTTKNVDSIIIILSSIINLATVLFVVMLLKWKKWGFWGFLASNLIAQLILTYNGLASTFTGWLAIIVLWAILQIKKDGVSCWKQLK